MILAIIFAQLWGVIQLIVLASLARTVRVRTVLAAMTVGLYAIGPITAFIQLSWIHLVAPMFGMSPSELQAVASYSVDPFIEEAMKLLPLLVLMMIPAIRRQWSVTDCVLIAAATGSGFGLAEHLFRYADYASTAQSVSGGYAMTIGSATPLVPGIFRTLTSWIPLGVFFEGSDVRVNWHLAWSAIGGLAIGLILRNPKKWARPAAAGLLLLVCLDHAAGNAPAMQRTWVSWLASPMHLVDSLLAVMVLAAIVVAWWLDQPSQRIGMALGPLLAAETAAPTRLAGTFTAAVSRMPWSIPWVLGFDRARRAYHAARAAAPDAVDTLRDAIVAERDSVDRRLAQPTAPPLLPPAWMPERLGTTVRSALRRPSVIIWLVLIAPSVLYLIIGGFPAASGLQAVMKGPIVWPVVLLITLLGQGRRAWRVLVGIRMLPAAVRHPMGDDAAMLALQAASGLGTLSLAGFTLSRVLSGVGAGERMLSAAHAADAMNRTQPAGAAAVAGSGGAFDGPSGPQNSNDSSSGSAGSSSGGDGGSGDGGGGPSAPGGSSGDGSPGRAPAAPPADPSGYSPLPDPVIPVKDLPDAPPEAPDYSPLPDPVIPVKDLPDAPPEAPEYSPLPDPVIPVKDLPDAPPEAPDYSPLPDPVIPVKDLPDAPPEAPDYSPLPDPVIPVKDLPDAPSPDEDGVGTRSPDDTPPAKPASTADPDQAQSEKARSAKADDDAVAAQEEKARSEQADDDAVAAQNEKARSEQADDDAVAAQKKLADSEQADDDAVAARQARIDAMKAADAADIKAATKDPASDPDVAAAQERTRDAQNAAERANNAAVDGDDPWDPNAPNKSAADAFEREAKEAKQAQDQAESDFAKRQAADPDAAAAKDAASRAQDAQDAADAKAAAAHQDAVDAQANAQAAAAKAASDAARAANPLQAAADDAKKALAEAQAKENDAFMNKDNQAYHDARAALDAARKKAADAQAAADAAKGDDSGGSVSAHKKP